MKSYFLASPPLAAVDDVSARSIEAEFGILFRSFVIVTMKSSMLSRKRGQAFSGIVIALRKFPRTFQKENSS